jgi:glycosyltransferase involved in cell wall biosynthesis
LAQRELPEVFSKARIFLFPTKFDCWGLVANEACAAGLPVFISPHAGAAGELVKSGINGYVLELDVNVWGEGCFTLAF